MIFVAEDNGYAETTASSWSVAGSQVGRGNGFGLPSRLVNGFDFFEVYEVAGEMIERARSGGGPSLMHVKLGRFYGHFEGDAMTYRAPDEIANLRAHSDPIVLFRQRVVEASLLNPSELDDIDRSVRSGMATIVADAKAAPPPTEADLMTDVYLRY